MSPVCLPKPRDEPEIYENVRAVAIGWGTVNVSTGEMPEKLQVIFNEIETLFIQLNQNVTQIANNLRILYVKIFLENLEYKTNKIK